MLLLICKDIKVGSGKINSFGIGIYIFFGQVLVYSTSTAFLINYIDPHAITNNRRSIIF